MKRVVTPELLDTDAGAPEEVEGSLQDLRWFNRYFGGVTTTTHLLAGVAERTRLRKIGYLDIGSATGYGPAAAGQALAKRGVALETTLLDRAISHFALNGEPPTAAAVGGDALQLPFADGSFDVAGSSLFVHHLEPAEVVRFLNEALRVCIHAVITNDLRRSFLHLMAARAGAPVYRSRITRFDAVASVRRAYTPAEMGAMLEQTNAARFEMSEHYFYRMGVVAWKHA